MLSYVVFFGLLVLLYLFSRTITRQLSMLFHHMFKSQTVSMYALAIILFPGVVIHEFSHFLAAVLLGVHAQNMEFLPKVIDGRLKLGSVQIQKTDFIRKTIIGISPIVGGIALLLLSMFLYKTYFPDSLLAILLIGIFYYQISNTMFSSKKDLEGTWIFFVILLVVGVALWIFQVPVLQFLFDSKVGVTIQQLLDTGSLYLGIALGVDIVVAGILFGLMKLR